MEIIVKRISYNLYKDYPKNWWWYFYKYKYISGFTFRICGLDFNIREKNATGKLIKIGNNGNDKIRSMV